MLFCLFVSTKTSLFLSLPLHTHANVFPANKPLAHAHRVTTHAKNAAFLLRRRSDALTPSSRRSAGGANSTAPAKRAALVTWLPAHVMASTWAALEAAAFQPPPAGGAVTLAAVMKAHEYQSVLRTPYDRRPARP